MQAAQRIDWVYQEGALACANKLTQIAPEEVYKEIKNAYQLSPEQLAVLQALAAWRYTYAVKTNTALNLVVKEAALGGARQRNADDDGSIARHTNFAAKRT